MPITRLLKVFKGIIFANIEELLKRQKSFMARLKPFESDGVHLNSSYLRRSTVSRHN